MNAKQRKLIAEFAARLEDAKGTLEEIHPDIETMRDEEQEKFDNLPESLQGSEKGQNMEQAVSSLDELVDAVQEALDALENAVGVAADLS